MQSGDHAMVKSVRRYNRFKFGDYEFAYQVRERMLESLKRFDINNNLLFEEEEIKQAFITILNENPNEVYYVVQNVFRYDKDGDRKITYQEFINFCLEQHFGQMAIQRLHRQKMYSQGNKRLMSLSEFIKTLEYCLNLIQVFGQKQDYERLFSEVDLDEDGWISYEDYFIFLKEYFGSLSICNEQELKPSTVDIQIPQVDREAANKVAKLIYSQLKVQFMLKDINRDLLLEPKEIEDLLGDIFKMGQLEKAEITNLLLQGQPCSHYDPFLLAIVPFYFCEYFVKRQGLPPSINESAFLQVFFKACSIVAVAPSEAIIKSLFAMADSKKKGQINLDQYVMLMGQIFEQFSFDKRGLVSKLEY